MDADARRKVAALEQELQRLRQEVDRLRDGLPPPLPLDPPAPAAPAAEPPLEFPVDARWLAASGALVLATAALLFMVDAAHWMAPAFQIASAAAFAFGLWGAGIYLHGRSRAAAALAGSGAVAAALVAVAALPTVGLHATVLVLAALCIACLIDAGLRHAEGQAVIAAVLASATAAVSLSWTAFSIPFAVGMALALLATSTWHRLRGAPVVIALGTCTVLILHAHAGAEPGPVLGAMLVVWAAFAAMAWVRPHEGDTVFHAVVWLATWGIGAWSLARWGITSGWWTAGVGVVALRLSYTSAPALMRRIWRAMAVVAFVVFPLQLPWPHMVGAIWLVELALAVSYRARRDTLAAQLAVASLSAALFLRLLLYEAPRIDAIGSLSTWLAATALFALSWLAAWRSKDLLGRVHLGLATAALLLLGDLLVPAPAAGFVWMGIAAVLVAEGMGMRSLDLRVAGLGAFGAAIFRLGFDLFAVHSVWRVLSLAGIGLLLLAGAWLWWGRQEPVEA